MRFWSAFVLSIACLSSPCPGEADTVTRSLCELDRQTFVGEDANRPFALTGLVIQGCTAYNKVFFLSDGTNCVLLVDEHLWPDRILQAGDIVSVTGRTTLVRYGRLNADCTSVSILGHVSPPPPAELTPYALSCQRNIPSRLVSIRGRIRDVIRDDIDPAYIGMALTDGRETVHLSTQCTEANLPTLLALIGAEVSATGIIRTDLPINLQRSVWATDGCRYIRGPILFVASPENITVHRPAPADPFDAPSVDSLRPIWPNELSTTLRCRAAGYVVSAARAHGFTLRTDDGRLVNVDLASGEKPQAGDGVVAVGLPYTDLFRINLSRAIWRHDNGHVEPATEPPAAVSIDDLLTDKAGHAEYKITRHGTLLRLAGTVCSLSAPGSVEHRIILEQNGSVLPIVAEPGTNPFPALELGMTVEVTGRCLMDTEPWRYGMTLPQVRDVLIAIRSPSDIRILARPSWWTAGRLLALITILALTLVAIVIWNFALRTMVIRRSRELLSEQVRRLSETLRVSERTRLATELHDTVAQNLSALSLQLDAASRLADSDPVAMKPVLAFASKALLSCRRELRDCLWDLRSQALEEADMGTAVRRALSPHLGSMRLIVRFCVSRRKIGDHTAHAVLRILGELAANAIRHGKASTIRIAGTLDGEGLKFSCTDDGCGFDTSTAPGTAQGHFGLQGIHDRVRTHRGTFSISSSPGTGTRAVVTLPAVHQETST